MSPMARWLRIAGRPPLIAQAPTATRIFALARNSRRTCTFSTLHTPPSISAMSHGLQCLMSVSGVRSNSAISTSSNSRSSMSSSDMWQPKQPASEVVASLTFTGVLDGPVGFISPLHELARVGFRADRLSVVLALADRLDEPDALDQNRADRADMRR